jgi:hypothetical protein
MSNEIANLGMLKSFADGFLDIVSFYMAAWAPYHTAFRSAAAGFIIPAGMAWTAVLTLKFPKDKTVAAVGGLAMMSFLVFLLSPRSDTGALFGGASVPSNIKYSTGAYWSYTLPATVYNLFDSALQSVEREGMGKNAALRIAYDANTKGVAEKWDKSPLKIAYIDYVSKCTNATMNEAGNETSVRALGHVGLHSGSGIGYTDDDKNTITAAIKHYTEYGELDTTRNDGWLGALVGYNPFALAEAHVGGVVSAVNGSFKSKTLAEQINKGIELLAKIPEESNPFNNITSTAPSGYQIPTANFWKAKWGLETDDGPQFIDAITYGDGIFRNPDIVEGSNGSANPNTALYPENCVEAYKMVDLGVAEYRKALAAHPKFKGATADYVSHATTTELAGIQKLNRARAEADAESDDPTRLNAYAVNAPPRGLFGRINDAAAGIYAKVQDVGATISEWLLQVKMPFFISTISMMCAGLITAFPIFAIISLFLGPKILISYIKLIVFCFLVILLNQTFLSMGANLIAVTNLMESVYNIGNIAKNNQGLEFSAATSKVVIFTSLMAIEVIVAKMLIWDDVKGLTSFNPGEGGSAALKMGGAALRTAAAVAAAPVGIKTKLAGMAAKSSQAAFYSAATNHIQKGGSVNIQLREMGSAASRAGQGGNGGSASSASPSSPGVQNRNQPQSPSGGSTPLVP